MEILFRSTKLAKILNESARLQREYGKINARQVCLRLAVLEAAACLNDVPTTRPDRRQQLTGDLHECFSVDVQYPLRIVFAPAQDPPPRRPDGGLNLGKITSVIILDIVDTHQ